MYTVYLIFASGCCVFSRLAEAASLNYLASCAVRFRAKAEVFPTYAHQAMYETCAPVEANGIPIKPVPPASQCRCSLPLGSCRPRCRKRPHATNDLKSLSKPLASSSKSPQNAPQTPSERVDANQGARSRQRNPPKMHFA